ncbi:hypothetical protein ACS0TY_033508 [Phlomoides rotata]
MAPKMMKSKVPMFSAEDYDDWKIRMQVHLSAMNDEMWSVIEDGSIVIEQSNTSNDQTAETPQVIPKPKKEWTDENKRRESSEKFHSRFTEILNKMESLGKEYSQREKNLKVLRALPSEWDMKVYEFDIDQRKR